VTTDLVDWPSIAAGGFPFPTAPSVFRLAGELSVMLTSPDPEVRDGHAYTAAARWIREGFLDEVLTDFGDAAADRFTHPAVQSRTFAPLILQCVLTRAQSVPGAVPRADAERWYTAFAGWYPAERDTRGWDDTRGWLHAVAHGADAAAAFAWALPARRPEILELCARRMTAPHADYRYAQLEDARLARAITAVLLAPGLTPGQATGWLDIVVDALAGGAPGPLPPWAFNTFATLQSLHLHLTHGLTSGGIPPHAPSVIARTTAILRLPYAWLA
jgi:hypothetical protein